MDFAQKLTWQLKRADLTAMIGENGEDFTHVEFIIGITSDGKTEYSARIVKVGPASAGRPVEKASGSRPTCPVPPGCNDDPD